MTGRIGMCCFAAWLVAVPALGVAAPPFDGDGRWIDLTHTLSGKSIFWPTARPFELAVDAEGITERGYYYSAYSFCTSEHGGTHIDAPVHFAKGRRSVDRIPLSDLIGPAVVIDVTRAAKANPNHQITTAEIERFERQHGAIQQGTLVLLNTGYAKHWPDANAYLGTAKRGSAGVAELSFPGLHPDAASLLVRRRVAAVGIDTASIDYGASKNFQSHVNLMTADIPAFENLAGLHALPHTGAFVIALPVKIEGGSGGPLRVIAWAPNTKRSDR